MSSKNTPNPGKRHVTLIHLTMGFLFLVVLISLGCAEKNAHTPPEEILTYSIPGFENETREHAHEIWEKVKNTPEIRSVTSEGAFSTLILMHPYSAGIFDPSEAEWVVIVSSDPRESEHIKMVILRLDYQTGELKKSYKFIYPVNSVTVSDCVSIIKNSMVERPDVSGVYFNVENLVIKGDYCIYSYPATDFGGTLIINRNAGRVVFYATTVWDGTGRLLIPSDRT